MLRSWLIGRLRQVSGRCSSFRFEPAGTRSPTEVNRPTAILLVVIFAGALALEACGVEQQTTAPSNESAATAKSGVPESSHGEPKPSQAPPPTPSPNQPAANATAANTGSDSTLEIAPAELPQAFATPPSERSGENVAPDAGNAQDYANNQNANTGPLPSFAGIDEYMNQEASYEAVGTGLPMTALLPPPFIYPYYYPYFYRYYYPIYVPAPIIVSRPLPPAYPPPPPPPNRRLRPSLPGGSSHGGHR